MSFLKSNKTNDYYKPTPVDNVCRSGKEPRKPKWKDNIRTRKENKIWGQHTLKCKKPCKTKKENKSIKDRITKDIKNALN